MFEFRMKIFDDCDERPFGFKSINFEIKIVSRKSLSVTFFLQSIGALRSEWPERGRSGAPNCCPERRSGNGRSAGALVALRLALRKGSKSANKIGKFQKICKISRCARRTGLQSQSICDYELV